MAKRQLTGLSIHDLTVGYSSHFLLAHLSIRILAGEIIFIVGSNGSGKTSLLRAISGIGGRLSGTVRPIIAGIEVSATEVNGSDMILVPQWRSCFLHLTIEHNLAAFTGQPWQRSMELLAKTWPTGANLLSSKKDRTAKELSGGERQVLASAGALVAPAPIVLLDEPGGGLSPEMRHSLFEAIRARASLCDRIFFVSEHEASQLSVSADRRIELPNRSPDGVSALR